MLLLLLSKVVLEIGLRESVTLARKGDIKRRLCGFR